MTRRQTSVPRQWLIADERIGEELWPAVRRLPKGSGVLVLYRAMAKGRRARLLARLRAAGRARGLVIADEAAGEAARVHDSAELRRAGLDRVPLILLSPLFRTRSHPDRPPLRRMQASALLRLARVPAIALGGMNERRFRRVERLGFSGWAGIDAWRLRSLKSRDAAPFPGT